MIQPATSPNFDVYNISSEGNISEILSHFNPQYIFNIIEKTIESNNSGSPIPYQIQNPNVVASFEQYFKYLFGRYPESQQEINDTRLDTYRNVIHVLCNHFKLSLLSDNVVPIDYYSLAYYMYDIFVANYNLYIINFFVRFIFNEREMLFDSLNIGDYKKNKDSATVYGKKMCVEEPKLGLIIANLNMVLDNIISFDFDFHTIISMISNPKIADYVCTYIGPVEDFYKESYTTMITNPESNAIVVTSIRLGLQNMYFQNYSNISPTI